MNQENTNEPEEINNNEENENLSPQTLSLQEIEEDIEDIDPDVLENLSPVEKEKMLRVVQTLSIRRASHHSGPLPTPDDLEKYNNIIPNGADRIMRMSEKQNDHRINMEAGYMKANNNDSRIGQIFGFIIALICIGATVYLGINDQAWLAGVVGSSTIIGLVTIFVLGQQAQITEKKDPPEDI